jgi:hypothetical protein
MHSSLKMVNSSIEHTDRTSLDITANLFGQRANLATSGRNKIGVTSGLGARVEGGTGAGYDARAAAGLRGPEENLACVVAD